jgi:hypothetical protein
MKETLVLWVGLFDHSLFVSAKHKSQHGCSKKSIKRTTFA